MIKVIAKNVWWICYGIGLFIMLAWSGIWPAVTSILIAAFAVWATKYGQP